MGVQPYVGKCEDNIMVKKGIENKYFITSWSNGTAAYVGTRERKVTIEKRD